MTQEKSTPQAQLSTATWFGILGWPIIVGTLCVLWNGHKTREAVETLRAERPDVAVVDDFALIKLAIDNGASRTSAQEISSEIARIVKGSGMDNTILLSRSMILYAPDGSIAKVSAAPPVAPPPVTLEVSR